MSLRFLLTAALSLMAGPSMPDPADDSPFGPRVLVFAPTMEDAAIQSRIDAISQQQAQAEFSAERYALLFLPGEYTLDVTVDYYVQASGLGRKPGDVTIHGTVQSVATNARGDVTTKFWRSAENFRVVPPENEVYWAVSQAAPYRRMHIEGDLHFDKRRWASGGFLANSIVEGTAGLVTGQQWFTRNSALGRWRGGNWNRTFVGTIGSPSAAWPTQPNTVIETTPVIRDKPFLTVADDGAFAVFVPELERETRGVTWQGEREPGRLIPIDDFHIAQPGDTAESMNAALSAGKHLLLTPGIYPIDAAIRIERPGTVVMGLGFATLVPQSGKAAIVAADVPGLTLASLMVDAGPEESTVLIQVGPEGSSGRHADKPTLLSDVFVRIGGAVPGRAQTALEINSHDVIVDHAWLWRADHGAGVGWLDNTAEHGLLVNGDDVTIYGLFNEHFQGHQTLWDGERGRVFFYQSEIPYDPPTQADWMDGDRRGFASYKVADHVAEHAAYGLGIYSFFNVRGETDPGVRLSSAIEAPAVPGVSFTHVTTFAGGHGGIDHPVNSSGPTTNAGQLRFFAGTESMKAGPSE